MDRAGLVHAPAAGDTAPATGGGETGGGGEITGPGGEESRSLLPGEHGLGVGEGDGTDKGVLDRLSDIFTS